MVKYVAVLRQPLLMNKAATRELLRRQLFERIYDKMTPEERKTFVRLAMQDRGTDEIMAALRQQQAQLADIKDRQQTFAQDFASNIAGNAVWDASLWIISRLSRLLR